LESLTQQTNLVQLTYAEPPQNPSSPKLLLNLVIGIFLGGIAGVGASMTLELRNRRIREDQEMVALLGIPLLGRIKPSRVTPNDRQRKHQGRLQPSTV
jgi:capsular polysaccharide biosynthesis protein